MATAAAADVHKIEGISEELRLILNSNLDQAPARRRVRDTFKEIQLGIDHCLFKVPCNDLKMEEMYEVNSQGQEVFCKSWLPEISPLKALVFFCHGYGDTCTFFFEGVARRLALSGFGVFAIDYPGFGLSEGLHGYIPSFERLVDDAIDLFSRVKEKAEYRNVPSFLFGQSMGGALALKIHLKQPEAWSGAILIAPMCKIADDMAPPRLLQPILIGIARFLPKAKLVPQKDIAQMGFKDLSKRKLTPYNVIAYSGKPRLRTAVELLRATQELELQLDQVCLPLLIMHGEADIVTDPSVSKVLYQKSCSSDKKLCLYQNAYHCLLEGESDDTTFQVIQDIITWLHAHTPC